MDSEEAGLLAKAVEKLSLSPAQTIPQDGTAANPTATVGTPESTSLKPGSNHYLPPHRCRYRKQRESITYNNAEQAVQPQSASKRDHTQSRAQKKASGYLNSGTCTVKSTDQQQLGYNQASFRSSSTKPQKTVGAALKGKVATQAMCKEAKPSKRERQLEQFAALPSERFIHLSSADQIATLTYKANRKDGLLSPAPSPTRPRAERLSPGFFSTNFRNATRIHVMDRPVPTTPYMQSAFAEPQALGRPRPLLVVLDLNGTLLCRKKYGGSNAFTPRPGVYPLLEYLFANHAVMVWSSARPQNVQKMVSGLFTAEQANKLVALWSRDELGLTPQAYNQKVQVYKQLSWVWNEPALRSHDSLVGSWSQANTVLLDDSVEKAASEPHNIITIDEYEAKPEQENDTTLDQVAKYLHILREQRDVSAYIRTKPFKYMPEMGKKADSPMQKSPAYSQYR